MAVLVVLLVLLLSEPIISHTTDHDNDNVLISMSCGSNTVRSLPNFFKNRNNTLNSLRMQLLSKGVVYARAQDLNGGESVFAVAQCRNYLSVDRCVACFDAGVSKMANCTAATAHISFDDCFIRYENFAEFSNYFNSLMDVNDNQHFACGNQSAYQPTTFSQAVDGLLSDIRDATPKASNFFVASTRQIVSENETVYAIAQCIKYAKQSICEICMNTAYNILSVCLPSMQGRFFNMVCFARYSKTPFFNDNQTTDITTVLKGTPDLKEVVYYNYKDLWLATNNFSQENVLGKGGFGEVFKAILGGDNVVAVKRLQVQHAGAKKEFENEVKLISNIHHRNLLRLLGWSGDGSNPLLIMEYMPNGSLDRFLWGVQRGTLNWNQRYEIILGIARGLVHLHDEFHFKIVHRDIKSSNILLSEDFRPKIADFGLARFQPEDRSHVSTRFAGTLGYTAPEYALHGILSDKVDTYSFGIVVLEITSGRSSTELYGSSTCWLLEDAWKMYENKKHINVIDETLNLNDYEHEHVMKIIEIALLCTMSPASDRPVMSEVVSMLQEGKSSAKIKLTRPTHFLRYEDRRIQINHTNPMDTNATQKLHTDTETTN